MSTFTHIGPYLWVSWHVMSGLTGRTVVTTDPPPPPPVCSNPGQLYNVLIFCRSILLNPFLQKYENKCLNN